MAGATLLSIPKAKIVGKKTYKRKNKRYNKRKGLGSGPFKRITQGDPLPPYKNCKISYSDRYTLTSGTVGIFGNEQIMRLNSLYDPDLSGTGHQPLYYDTMSLVYKRYKVTGVSIDVLWTDPQADGVVCAMCIQPSSEVYSVAGKSVGVLDEQPMSVVRYLNDSGSQNTRVKQFVPIYQIEGMTKSQFNGQADGDYTAVTTTNPAKVPYLRMGAASLSGTSGVGVTAIVKLTYHVRFYERIIQSQS